MEKLFKPERLKPGDKVAAVSISAGLAGSIPYRYEIGKKQFEQEFKVQLVEMKHTLKNLDWISKNPQARADDLMEAFSDKSIKGIISTIGGEDSIRIIPYIDIDIIKSNPKVFLGYSDTTVTHFICYKAGLTSFYGPSILADFAENQGMFPYMVNALRKAIFMPEPIGEVYPSSEWTTQYLDWFEPKNQNIKRDLRPNEGRKLIQGKGIVSGNLIGGCIQVFTMLNGTEIWPESFAWDNSIIFLEISESNLPINFFKYILRNMGAQGIWNKAAGVLFARPGGQRSDEEILLYETTLKHVISEEFGCYELPILSRMEFGHTNPVFTVPYGVKGEIDCYNNRFTILEAGVL
jgi:muramoyltetrapeptide carboxypeptidase LdcA involved in peptidoglycan recycling